MDPVTTIGLLAAAGMFCSGVALVWIGLARQVVQLPEGGADVIAAVTEGRMGIDPPEARPTPAIVDEPTVAHRPAVRRAPARQPVSAA